MRNEKDGCYIVVAISARGAIACALGGAAVVAAAILFGPEALIVTDFVSKGQWQTRVARIGTGDAERPCIFAVILWVVQICDAAVPRFRRQHCHQIRPQLVPQGVDFVVVTVAGAPQA